MVNAKPPQRHSYPILGFASALATVLLVLVLLSDSLVSQGLRPISLLASDAPAGEVVEELLQAPVEEAAPMPQSVPPETSRETQGEGPTETPEEPALAMEMLQATPGPTPCDDLSAGSPCGYLAPDSDLEIPAEAPASRVFEQEPLRQLAAARVVLRVIEIALVLIAISSGIAAYIFYRRHL
jgi:hypothetical protein